MQYNCKEIVKIVKVGIVSLKLRSYIIINIVEIAELKNNFIKGVSRKIFRGLPTEERPKK